MKASVSDLRECLFCPRSVYLRRVLRLKPVSSPDTVKSCLWHAARKELSLRQARVLEKTTDSDCLMDAFISEAECIINDLPNLCRDLLDLSEAQEHIPAIRKDLYMEIEPLVDRLLYIISEAGLERCLEKTKPWRTSYLIDSPSISLTGRIDKVMKGATIHPLEVKTKKPGDCFLDSDRLEVCAYSMLLEQDLGASVPYGFVEYTPLNEMRPVMNTGKQRDRVLDVRDKVLEILSGNLPEICPHGSGRKCESCGFFDACYEI